MGPGRAAGRHDGRGDLKRNGVLAMGGVYTTYLLIAYGVTTVVVIGNLLAARRQFRRTRDRLR